jgi:aldehyde dehydrogenase (NAD+)
MNKNVEQTIQAQRLFFESQKTKDLAFRIQQLEILKTAIEQKKEILLTALEKDLKKPRTEAFISEFGQIISEIKFALKKISSWAKPEKVSTPLALFPAKSYILPEPYGVTLIVSSWNYPLQLCILPLIGAIAAGNCAIIKPSELSPNTASEIEKLISENFDPGFISVIQGDKEVTQNLLKEKFDYIFFTGSTAIGKIVMQAAAQNLTPITLEVGGKSPCIVDKNIDLSIAAKRIVWGKFLNAGQTCIAPDYILVAQEIKNELINDLVKAIKEFYGNDPQASSDLARIVDDAHFDRLCNFLKDGKIILGGQTNREKLYIAPTLIEDVKLENKIMQEEIFGPILPIISFENLSQVIKIIKEISNPLAIYIFSEDKNFIDTILNQTTSGGVTLNDTVLHASSHNLPFGGVGASGFGTYHGKATFDTFSHKKSVLKNSFWFDNKLRYPPYKNKLGKLERLFRYFF